MNQLDSSCLLLLYKLYIVHTSTLIRLRTFCLSFLAPEPNKSQRFGEAIGSVDKFTLVALISAFQAGGVEMNAVLMTHRWV